MKLNQLIAESVINALFLEGFAIARIQHTERATKILNDCAEYFDQRADAEYFPNSPRPYPNEEMTLLTEIREFMDATMKDKF